MEEAIIEPVATSPLPRKIEVKEEPTVHAYLNFNSAINQLVEDKKVTRLEWANSEYYCYLKDNVLTLHKPDGHDYQWVISTGDLEADDWIVL